MSKKTKIIILWSVLALLALLLVTPLTTISIKVDLPPGAEPGDAAAAERSGRWFTAVFVLIVGGGLLLFGRRMHRRILRAAEHARRFDHFD